jgi:hypothetical protein
MPITVTWDDADPTILVYSYSGRWTWAEYQAATRQAFALVGGTQPVDVIADFSSGGLLPENAMSNFRRSIENNPQALQFRVAVLVLRHDFMARMVDVFTRIYGRMGGKLRTTESLDDARRIIHQFREQSALE